MKIFDTLVKVSGTTCSFLHVVGAPKDGLVKVAERAVISTPDGMAPGGTNMDACADLPEAGLASWSVWDGSMVKPAGYTCIGAKVAGFVRTEAPAKPRKDYGDDDAGRAQFLKDLDNADFEVRDGFEASFLESNLGRSAFSPKQREVIDKLMEKYAHRL